MLPPVRDLAIGKVNMNELVLNWTNPARSADVPAALQPQQSRLPQEYPIVDYDVRFLSDKREITNESWARAKKIKFRSSSGDNRYFDSESKKSNALISEDPEFLSKDGEAASGEGKVSLKIDYGKKKEKLKMYWYHDKSAKHDLSPLERMYREPEKGCFALKYKSRESHQWSPTSNCVYNICDLPPQSLWIRTGSAGVSAGPVTAGVLSITIGDPRLKEWAEYLVHPIGLSAGAKIGFTHSFRETFKPQRRLHYDDFDGMGINLLSQGFAAVVGYGRLDAYIFDDVRAAATMNRFALKYDTGKLVAGPIKSSGVQFGVEANALSIVIGKISRLK